MARVIVGIAGGIAAYKAVGLVRQLVLDGHDVHVVPTPAALRFIGVPTLEALSRNPVSADLFDDVAQVRHVALGQSADLIVVAPATANTFAKIAAGLADDLLGTTVLASRAPLVLAPAMHTEMWTNAATRANLDTLVERGVHIVGPGIGRLTGDDSGEGRMAEVDEISEKVNRLLAGTSDLAGRRIVVSAGGTREALDPVRFLGNRSSGLQGTEIARVARDRGADVILVAGHLEVPVPVGIRTVRVSSADDMLEAMLREAAGADAVIMAAAVADYRPANVSESKIRKDDTGDDLTLHLVRNPDVLHTLATAAERASVVIGFAAETAADRSELLQLGRRKIARKDCDFLVLNTVGWTEGFTQPRNDVVIIDRAGHIVVEAAGTKASVAASILDLLSPSLPGAR